MPHFSSSDMSEGIEGDIPRPGRNPAPKGESYMTTYTYITRNAAILACVSSEEYRDFRSVNLAPYYFDQGIDGWEARAVQAFAVFVDVAVNSGSYEYNGSSSYDPGEQEDTWVVEVYESPLDDFEVLDRLVEHEQTVAHGYVEFVDQEPRYADALLALQALSTSPAAQADDIMIAIYDVRSQSREHDYMIDDIVEALAHSAWDYVDGEVVVRAEEVEAA